MSKEMFPTHVKFFEINGKMEVENGQGTVKAAE